MPKITKARGLTISDARVKRGGAIVSAVADVETGEVVPVALEVPTGSASVVVAWIGDDPARAAAAEGDTRRQVVAAVARVTGGG